MISHEKDQFPGEKIAQQGGFLRELVRQICHATGLCVFINKSRPCNKPAIYIVFVNKIPMPYKATLPVEAIRVAAGYTKEEIGKIGSWKMKLSTIPLNGVDEMQKSMAEQSFAAIRARGGAVDGEVTTAVNAGIGDGFMEVTTRGKEQFVLYNIFVAKIRRESEGMVEATQARRVAWCKMSQAFIDEYGEEKTPRDIVECLKNVRTHFNID
jgi:hypothetical protein